MKKQTKTMMKWTKNGKAYICGDYEVKKGFVYMWKGFEGEKRNVAWVVCYNGKHNMNVGFKSAKQAKIYAEGKITANV